jgi:hypothetical protein
MRFLSFYQGAIAATRHTFCIRLFEAFPITSAAATPQTSMGLLAVGPDMAKTLTVVALRKTSLISLWFYLDDNMV